VPGSTRDPERAETSSETIATASFISALEEGSSVRASRQQALTTAVPPAIRCQPSAASRVGSQLAPERVAP
jgi:hypothetical protein